MQEEQTKRVGCMPPELAWYTTKIKVWYYSPTSASERMKVKQEPGDVSTYPFIIVQRLLGELSAPYDKHQFVRLLI